jgi:hypothetical protein
MNIKDPKEREKELLKRKGEFTASKIELDIKALMSVPLLQRVMKLKPFRHSLRQIPGRDKSL